MSFSTDSAGNPHINEITRTDEFEDITSNRPISKDDVVITDRNPHINEITGTNEFKDNTSNRPRSRPDVLKPFSVPETRHKLATNSLYLLYFLQALIAVHLFIPIFVDTKKISPDNKELITLMWTSEMSLLGTVLGFYFSSAIGENKVTSEQNKED
jgi:hypothetical protein